MHMTRLIQEREDMARQSMDCLDLAFHYKQCLENKAASLAQAAAAAAAHHQPNHSKDGGGGDASLLSSPLSLVSSDLDLSFDPEPVLQLYSSLFPHALTPQRNWAELLSSSRAHNAGPSSAGATAAAAAAAVATPGSALSPATVDGLSPPLDHQRAADVQAGVALLADLIEWHGRLEDVTKRFKQQPGQASNTSPPPPPSSSSSTHTFRVGQPPSAPFPIAHSFVMKQQQTSSAAVGAPTATTTAAGMAMTSIG